MSLHPLKNNSVLTFNLSNIWNSTAAPCLLCCMECCSVEQVLFKTAELVLNSSEDPKVLEDARYVRQNFEGDALLEKCTRNPDDFYLMSRCCCENMESWVWVFHSVWASCGFNDCLKQADTHAAYVMWWSFLCMHLKRSEGYVKVKSGVTKVNIGGHCMKLTHTLTLNSRAKATCGVQLTQSHLFMK